MTILIVFLPLNRGINFCIRIKTERFGFVLKVMLGFALNY